MAKGLSAARDSVPPNRTSSWGLWTSTGPVRCNGRAHIDGGLSSAWARPSISRLVQRGGPTPAPGLATHSTRPEMRNQAGTPSSPASAGRNEEGRQVWTTWRPHTTYTRKRES